MEWFGNLNYVVAVVLMMCGFYLLMSARNLVKKLVGLNLFQTSVFVFYISMGKVTGGRPPIHEGDLPADTVYSNPLPHVLILTAIVVGVASTALGLALTLRIKDHYGTIEEDEIDRQDVVR